MKYKILLLNLLSVCFAHGMDNDLAKHKEVFRHFQFSTPANITRLTKATEFMDNWARAATIDNKEKEQWLYRCNKSQTVLIPFLIQDLRKDFKKLLDQELEKANQSRWPQIKELLPGVGSFIIVPDDQLQKKLIALANNNEANHNKWYHILQAYKKRTAPPKPQLRKNEPFKKKKNQKTIPRKKKSGKRVNKKKRRKTKKKAPSNKTTKTEEDTITSNDLFWLSVTTKDVTAVHNLLQNHKEEIPIDGLYQTAEGTALEFAARIGHVELCKVLLAHGAKPNHISLLSIDSNQGNKVKSTPLLTAINVGQLAAARVLLEHGANPNTPITYLLSNEKGYALDLAAANFGKHDKYTSKTQAQMIALLLKHGAWNFSGKTVMLTGSKAIGGEIFLNNKEHREMIVDLLDIQTPEETIDCCDGNILFLVDEEKLEEAIKSNDEHDPDQLEIPTLPERQKSTRGKLSQTDTLFWQTVTSQKIENVQAILKMYKNQIDVNCFATKKGYEFTPLYYAVTLNSPELCTLLLEHEAKPDRICSLPLPQPKGKMATTPLLVAINIGYLECVRKLLKHNANPNIPLIQKVEEGVSMAYPLDCATEDIKTKDGYTPELQKQMIKLLLLNGATKFSGIITLQSEDGEDGISIDLEKKRHRKYIKDLLFRQTAQDTIKCDYLDITLIQIDDCNEDSTEEKESGNPAYAKATAGRKIPKGAKNNNEENSNNNVNGKSTD